MAIIKQGILGGFKKRIGSVVGSSWKGIATMRSLPLSVANPRTAAQVENRDRFKACAGFASIILASIIKPLMDRFAGQMSGYNYFTKLNKEIFADPENPTWADLVISKGRMLPAVIGLPSWLSSKLTVPFSPVTGDRYALPTDKIYALVVDKTTGAVVYQGDTGNVRTANQIELKLSKTPTSGNKLEIYISYLHADGSEVSETAYKEFTMS